MEEIRSAAEALRRGELVAFPTETVYGLGADAENESAVRAVFAAKARPPDNPLIVHIGSALQLNQWVTELPEAARVLADRFWPGPLTLVLRRGPRLCPLVSGGLATVAMRVPSHPVALALLDEFGGAIAAPSANRSGRVSPTQASHVREELGAAVCKVLDGGPSEIGVESTIVDVSGSTVEILRPGAVTREQLRAALGEQVRVAAHARGGAPGQYPAHYCPAARVELVQPERLVERARSLREHGERVGVLAQRKEADRARFQAEVGLAAVVPDDLVDFARRLYSALRHLDSMGCTVILAVPPEPIGLGLAIVDRLQRAAGAGA